MTHITVSSELFIIIVDITTSQHHNNWNTHPYTTSNDIKTHHSTNILKSVDASDNNSINSQAKSV